MNGSLKVVQALVLLSFVGLFFASCGGNQSTLSSIVASGTTTGGNTGQTSGTPTIEEEEAAATIPPGYDAGNLFVTVPQTMDYTNFVSAHHAYSQRCTFTTSSVVNDLTCVVNVNELAVYHDGLKLQYNIPADQCKYFGTQPYWYYSHEIGAGPSMVSATVAVSAGAIVSQLCQVNGGTIANCATTSPPISWNDIEWRISETGADAKCVYDTSDEDEGANCCFGKYRKVIKLIVDGEPQTSDEDGQDWGGTGASCVGGPGKTDWEEKDKTGFPAYLIEKTVPGERRTKLMKVTPPIESIGLRTNVPIANYFNPALHTHTGFGTASGTRFSNYPYFVDPVSDRSGTLIVQANPHYIFDCLDAAFEINYRIRVMVQEWDTVAALSSYITSGVSGIPLTSVGNDSGTADEPGSAPDECPGLAGDDCNNAVDIDDHVRSIPWTSYSNAFPTSRTLYFPGY